MPVRSVVPRVGVKGGAVAVAALVALAVTAAVCTRDADGPRLRALRSDPLGRSSPTAGTLVEESHVSEGSTLGKPRQAKHSRWFSVREAEAAGALEELVQVAEAAGWNVTRNPDGSAVADKVFGGRTGSVVLVLHRDHRFLPSGLTPPVLQVAMHL